MGIRLTTDADLTSVANAIRTAGGTNASLTFPTGFVNAIGTIQSGSSGGSKGDVTFYDYDGTIVTSYSATDFANLNVLPANPTHSGLTAQGWNWSLVNAKAHVAKYGELNIGQMYITDDGKTRLYIHIANVARNVVPLYWYQSASNGVTINWGDGTTEETIDAIGDLDTTHIYTSAGDYIITLNVTSGTAKLGYGTSGCAVLGPASDSNTVYLNMLKKVEIGNNMSLYTGTFVSCYSLFSITIPDSITSIEDYTFAYCYSLSNIIIPDSITIIGNNAFKSCHSLTNIIIPDSMSSIKSYVFYNCFTLPNIIISDDVTSIENYAFYNCYTLSNIIIPESVTSIGSGVFDTCCSLTCVTIPEGMASIGSEVFNGCRGMKEYHMLSETPPTLSNINAFNNIPSDCIIYVPYSADHSILETYKTASNWSEYASYMQEEPQS